jgi:hypothetical protein
MQACSGDFTPGWQSGFITEYLSARWFELMRRVVKEFLRLGLVPYLYDENYYPSGLAGGHVSVYRTPGSDRSAPSLARVQMVSPPRVDSEGIAIISIL